MMTEQEIIKLSTMLFIATESKMIEETLKQLEINYNESVEALSSATSVLDLANKWQGCLVRSKVCSMFKRKFQVQAPTEDTTIEETDSTEPNIKVLASACYHYVKNGIKGPKPMNMFSKVKSDNKDSSLFTVQDIYLNWVLKAAILLKDKQVEQEVKKKLKAVH